MMNIVVATKNEGKLKEIRELLAERTGTYRVLSMAEAGVTDEIAETGNTFAENAKIKATYIRDCLEERKSEHGTAQPAEAEQYIVMADDSGLEVAFLNGSPGVYTARYAGENATSSENIAKLLNEMEGVPESARQARFVCCIAVIKEDGTMFTVEETCEGYIASRVAPGENGFGYDPVFFLPAYGATAAQLPAAEKNKISHRGKAVRKAIQML